MDSYTMEWDAKDIPGAIKMAFNYIEAKDEIVGFVYACPSTIKTLVLSIPDDIDFDYIPDGIGMIRTAYLKRASINQNEIRFVNQSDSIRLRLFLK
jgi:hypothetical protein